MSEPTRLALAARIFSVVAIVSVSVLLGGPQTRGTAALVAVVLVAVAASISQRLPQEWIAITEGAVAAILATSTYPANDAVVPYLVIPPLIGAVTQGVRGLLLVMAAEVGCLVLAWSLLVGALDRVVIARGVTWFACAIGLGLLGLAFRRAVVASSVDASYRSALDLIKQLHRLSGKLTAGLDAVSLADGIIAQAGGLLPTLQAAVYVRTPSGLTTPLRFSQGASPATFEGGEGAAALAWAGQHAIVAGRRLALPLEVDAQVVAVLVCDCAGAPEQRTVTALAQALAPETVQLQAALLFGDVRDSATSEERQRLAREVHDGVAQDVASLGYLVDHLADTVTDPEQLEQVGTLRGEVTRVVTELRHSVFDLRNVVGANQGLGQSISSFARHVGSHSDLTIHVTLDEAATRLRSEVEAELLRIAQEAMNNARKHSRAENLWVTCAVQPPHANIEVLDDGVGLGHGREDSHGLGIMRERAARVGADFSIEAPVRDGRGTRVRVLLGTEQGESA